MKDPRGVWRGKCTRCTCKDYQYELNSERAACSYCECPAPAHEEMNDPATQLSQSLNSSSSSTSETLSSSASDVLTIHLNDVPFLDQLLSAPSSSVTEPTSDEILDAFPKVFPKRVQEALSTRQVMSTHKDIIVQKVVDGLNNANKLSNACLQKAAKKIPQKWSPLKSSLDPENKGLYEKLKRRRARIAKPDKRPCLDRQGEPPQTEEAISPDKALEDMKNDWSIGKREAAQYRLNMAACRGKRKDDARKMPGLQLLRTYPALGIEDVLLEEFEIEVKVPIHSMIQNWEKLLPHIIEYFLKAKIDCRVTGSTAEKTLDILQNLHLVPMWHNKKQDDNISAKVLSVFPENTALNAMMPKAKEPPRMICTGSVEANTLSICSYLDTEPLFSCDEPCRAMLLLLASYFVLGIKWPAFTRLPLIFLTCCTVGPSIVAKDLARNNKMQDLLKTLKVL